MRKIQYLQEKPKKSVRQTSEKLINKRKEIGQQVNEQKTTILIIFRNEHVQDSLVAGM